MKKTTLKSLFKEIIREELRKSPLKEVIEPFKDKGGENTGLMDGDVVFGTHPDHKHHKSWAIWKGNGIKDQTYADGVTIKNAIHLFDPEAKGHEPIWNGHTVVNLDKFKEYAKTRGKQGNVEIKTKDDWKNPEKYGNVFEPSDNKRHINWELDLSKLKKGTDWF